MAVHALTKPVFLIIDGNSFMHRAYHSRPPLKSKEGFPTGAITGALSMINSLLKKLSPAKVVVCFDAKGKNFRHDIYPEYKANRSPTDEDLKLQFEPVKEIIKAWGLPMVCEPNVEADDTMGTLAVDAEKAGYAAVIGTSDKDMRQLVTENILIVDTKDADGAVPYGIDGVIDRMGVPPNLVRDQLAIVGDKVDGVPGVNKVGMSIATEWLKEHGSLQSIMDKADSFKGKRGEYLRESLDFLPIAYELVTIKTDVPLPFNAFEVIGERNEKALFNLVIKYSLSKFGKDVSVTNPNNTRFDTEVVLCDHSGAVSILDNKLRQANVPALYIDIACIEGEDWAYLGLNNAEKIYAARLIDIKDALSYRFNANAFPRLRGVDVKNSLVHLMKEGVVPPYQQIKLDDVKIACYADNGAFSKAVTIQDMNNRYINKTLSPLREKYNLDKKTARWDKLTIKEALDVKAEELGLAVKVFRKIDKAIYQSEVYRTESELLPLLASMQHVGVKVDKDKLAEIGSGISQKMESLYKSITDQSGLDFINLQSPKQVAHMLFDVMGIPTKKVSTSESVLKKLAKDHKIVQDVMEYRSLSKNNSTYIEGILNRLDDKDKVHPTFKQAVASTGRLSAEDPNIQSIPVRSQIGKRIRSAFIADDDYLVAALDYSQIEIRVLAHLSQDDALVAAFKSNLDVHQYTASDVLGIPYEDVSDDQRRLAKAVNFGLIYGMGPKKLAESADITLKEAKDFIEAYFEKYSKVKEYMESILEHAREHEFVLTATGRKIMTPDINATNTMMRVGAELSAKNAPFQGTAADIVKMAMLKVASHPDGLMGEDCKMIMQVHDELVFLIKPDVVDDVMPKIIRALESSMPLSVPLKVDSGISSNWKDSH